MTMQVWEDRDENEDNLRHLKKEGKPKFYIKITRWIDWEYLPLKLFKRIFKRRDDNVDKD